MAVDECGGLSVGRKDVLRVQPKQRHANELRGFFVFWRPSRHKVWLPYGVVLSDIEVHWSVLAMK